MGLPGAGSSGAVGDCVEGLIGVQLRDISGSSLLQRHLGISFKATWILVGPAVIATFLWVVTDYGGKP